MEDKTVLYQYILNRVNKQNKNFFMVYIGATGSGKSYAALRTAQSLDPTFDRSRICFTGIEFMDTINDLVERSKKGENISGKVILWDEFGVAQSSREFMTASNRAINYFFQTSRHLNLIVLLTVPLLSFIDSASRKLSHCFAEMCGMDHHRRRSLAKIKLNQTNVITGKEYPKYMRYSQDGMSYVLKQVYFKLPSKDLTQVYEDIKVKYSKDLGSSIRETLAEVEQKKRRKNTNGFTEGSMQEDIWKVAMNGYETQQDLANKMSKVLGKPIEKAQLNRNIISMRRKGLDIRDFKQKKPIL